MGAAAEAGAHKWQDMQQRRREAADTRAAKRLEAGQVVVDDGSGGGGSGGGSGQVGGEGVGDGEVAGGALVEGAEPGLGLGVALGEGRPAWEADGGAGSMGQARPAWRVLSLNEEAGGKLAYSSWKRKVKVAPAPAPAPVYNMDVGAVEATPVSALGPGAGPRPSEERDDGDAGGMR